MDLTLIVAYSLLLALVWIPYGFIRRRRSTRALALLEDSRSSGMHEPASLHPRIDPSACIGCGTCVPACPEGEVIGLIGGKAVLVQPANCIGHGACKDACPQGAITLVLGTETRGVDIPALSPDFETNVPGIFVAGELGGMGLIRNAVEQGRQAIESVAATLGDRRGDALDVLIVGAGPAGFASTLAAQQHGLSSVTIEQDTLGGTVAHYPRGKIVMTAPMILPLHGKVKLRETTKEALLELWRSVEQATEPNIRYGERVEGIRAVPGGFDVETTRDKYRSRTVLLAIGRRGTPRQLGVPGEESSKVVYRLIDPEQYRRRKVLVVGGGDSAIEAAVSVADLADAEVTLSYRGEAFSRVKPKNRGRVEAAAAAGRLRVELGSRVVSISDELVELQTRRGLVRLPNDAVIVCAGGILPTDFLRSIGIEIETRRGTA